MSKRLALALVVTLAFALCAAAQEVDVDRYTINVRIDPASNALDARAVLAISNLGESAKPKLYLRLTKLATVRAVSVDGSSAAFETIEDRRAPALNQIVISPSTPIAPGAKATVDLSYRIEAPEASGLVSIYPGEVLVAPESVWFPMPSTGFAIYGATTAPFSLTVTAPVGFRAASSGTLKSEANQTYTFDQPLNSLPFFVAAAFDQPKSIEHSGIRIEFYVQQGLAAPQEKADGAGSDAVTRIGNEARRIIDYFTKVLGPLPAGTSFRVISSYRTGNVAVPGALVLNEQVFRRYTLNAGTIELLADALARIWIDGRVRVRGQEPRAAQGSRPAQKARSGALIHDSLPRYMAALYIEERFGKEAARAGFDRFRWGYTPIAQSGRDAELGVQTLSLPSYGAAAFAKGPLVLRLIAETAGRDKFLAAVASLLGGPQTKVVTPEDFRQALAKAAVTDGDVLIQQWVETIIEPDIVVGTPQPGDTAGTQRVNLRNLGTGEVTVPLLAITASGKRLTMSVKVPSEDITTAEIATAEKIESVEVDPDKLIIQTNYDNDRKPPKISAQTLLSESIAAFNKSDYAQAEAKLREAARSAPGTALVRAWLARTLQAAGKSDEAAAEANAAIRIEPPIGSALAWAHLTLGKIAAGRNQPAEAAQHFRRALAEAEEAPAQYAGREALARAERAANPALQADPTVRTFIAQLDTLIKQPSSDKLFTAVFKSTLKRFVQGLTVTPPTAWATEVLREDKIDGNRVALDVALKVKAEGRDQFGTAVFVLYRTASGWMLEDVQLFNVK